MSTTTTTPTPTEETHATAAHLADAKRLFGETRPTVIKRILWLDSVLAYGVDVKTLADDLREANRTDPGVPVLSPAMLGYYRFPRTVADKVGTTVKAWAARNAEEVEAVYYAGKHAGLKVAGNALRDAVANIDASKHREREEATTEAAEKLTATVKPAKVSAPRGKSGKGTEPVKPGRELSPASEATREDVLAAIRYATSAVNLGLSWDATLESAVAELTKAVSDRRKSDKSKRQAAPATPATVAAGIAA